MKITVLAVVAAGLLACSAVLPTPAETEPDCTSVRTGAFVLKTKEKAFRNMRLLRNDTAQIELMPDAGLKSVFTIEWTDDCSYILHTPRHYFMEQLMPPDSDLMDTVFVTIDQVKTKGYHYSAYSSATPEFIVDGWINFEK